MDLSEFPKSTFYHQEPKKVVNNMTMDEEDLIVQNLYKTNKVQQERIKELETALESIWPFIEEDFPKGTGDNHGTCASDLYVLAARQIEQALKG